MSQIPRTPIDGGQGPEGLTRLLWQPPDWVQLLFWIAAAVTAVLVAYRLHQRNLHVSLRQHREMQIIAATVVLVATATLGMVNLAAQPFWVDSLVGLLVGYGTVLASQLPIVGRIWSRILPDTALRLVVLWIAIGACGYWLPQLATVNGLGVPLTGGRIVLGAISLGLALQVLVQEKLAAQTDSEYFRPDNS